MHFSAQRGIAIACRLCVCLSVRLSVCDVGGLWSHRFEQIQDGGHRHDGKISSGDISATGRPIHFMFCSRVGFSWTADLMALFPVRTNKRWRPPPSWKNFKWPYLRNLSSVFGYRVRFSGTADLMALFSIRINSRWQPPPSWIISNGHISATAHGLLI